VSRKVAIPGGRLEYAVLVAVWESDTTTIRELHNRVGAPLDLAYTTTARVLDRLCEKGLVTREKVGKLVHYKAAKGRREVERARLSKTLSSVLGEGPRPALATLVEVIDEIAPDLLDELTRSIKVLRRGRREP
jgi:predicted transcriptional regulator